MIAVTNIRSEDQEKFENVLQRLDNELNASLLPECNTSIKSWGELTATQYEEELFYRLDRISYTADLKYQMEQIGGQKFPDLVAWIHETKGFGIEAKTTKKNHWKSTGSSIMESTRVDNVKQIYLSFAKLGGKAAFKTKCYEDCLSDVAVTHSPRYLIDMELQPDYSIFSKIGKSYDEVRLSEKPFQHFKNYYEDKHQGSWWMESENSLSSPVIRFYSDLDSKEKKELFYQLMLNTPEVLGRNSVNKYKEASLYLLQKSILNPSLRDLFSGGGRQNDKYFGTNCLLPKVIYHFSEWVNSESFVQDVKNLSEIKFSTQDWINTVDFHINSYADKNVPSTLFKSRLIKHISTCLLDC